MRQTDRILTWKLYRLTTVGVVLFVLSGVFTSPAMAQSGASPAELRRANDQLQERIIVLEAALEESQRRIDSLEAQIESLASEPETAQPQPTTPNTVPIEPTERPIPSEASSCPDSLYGSLVDNYNESIPGIEIPTYAKVQQWIERVRHERQSVTWLVEVHDVAADQDAPASLFVNLIDPQSGEAICNDFKFPVSHLEATRIRDATEVVIWEITGTIAANPVADRSRPEFEHGALPMLIGPYAVFGWKFDVKSITPVEQADDTEVTEPQHR